MVDYKFVYIVDLGELLLPLALSLWPGSLHLLSRPPVMIFSLTYGDHLFDVFSQKCFCAMIGVVTFAWFISA